MKGKISADGFLFIKRACKEGKSLCPFSGSEGGHEDDFGHCGDWCPLFGEPTLHYADEIHGYTTYLMLCHRTLEFDELIDERTNVKGKQT
jgi:hypothetical protein